MQVGLLNVDGYYNSLLTFIDKAVEEGFICPNAPQIFVSAPNAKELLNKLEVNDIRVRYIFVWLFNPRPSTWRGSYMDKSFIQVEKWTGEVTFRIELGSSTIISLWLANSDSCCVYYWYIWNNSILLSFFRDIFLSDETVASKNWENVESDYSSKMVLHASSWED